MRQFEEDDTLAEVKFAVDDAVDLAFLFSMEPKTQVVAPSRVILALSGKPWKPQSQRNLQALIAAGAKKEDASQTDVLKHLRAQAALVKNNGLLIAAFATHGISVGGTQYLLTKTSLLQDFETAVSETKLRDIVTGPSVPRSLILIDACRKRLTVNTRDGDADPRSAAARLRALGKIDGHVVLSAAPGAYAYDDPSKQNGVITAAVIDGLRCRARRDEQGWITVDALSTYVEEEVLSWIRIKRDPKARTATHLYVSGGAKKMPLSTCDVTGKTETLPSRPR